MDGARQHAPAGIQHGMHAAVQPRRHAQSAPPTWCTPLWRASTSLSDLGVEQSLRLWEMDGARQHAPAGLQHGVRAAAQLRRHAQSAPPTWCFLVCQAAAFVGGVNKRCAAMNAGTPAGLQHGMHAAAQLRRTHSQRRQPNA